VLLGLAVLIGCYAHNPFAGRPLILITACVALGAVLATWPFIADYEQKQNEALDERQRGLEALAQTIASSAGQISIAAQSLPGIAETAAKNLSLAEQLPARLQEKMGEIKQRLAEVSVVRKESSASEAAMQKNLMAAGDQLDVKAAQIFKQLDAKIAVLAALAEKLSASATPLPAEKPARAPSRKEPEMLPARPEPAGRVEEPARPERVGVEPAESVAEKPVKVEAAAPETPAEDQKSPRKRVPRKPKLESPEPSLDFDASTKSTATQPARGLEPAGGEPVEPVETASSPSAPPVVPMPPASMGSDEFSQPSPDETAPVSAVSADGATRLLVTAYIGIGNKLFLRGDGPGLSWDEGVPLQFVSIGKWRWETADATAPVQAKLYKNDELVCAALGQLTLDPGQQAEVTAVF
jgi:hypothetical protein